LQVYRDTMRKLCGATRNILAGLTSAFCLSPAPGEHRRDTRFARGSKARRVSVTERGRINFSVYIIKDLFLHHI
jgi:hypothetical protein